MLPSPEWAGHCSRGACSDEQVRDLNSTVSKHGSEHRGPGSALSGLPGPDWLSRPGDCRAHLPWCVPTSPAYLPSCAHPPHCVPISCAFPCSPAPCAASLCAPASFCADAEKSSEPRSREELGVLLFSHQTPRKG